MKEELEAIILDELRKMANELQNTELLSCDSDTALMGANSALDSIALVTLLINIEESIGAKYSKEIVIADEKAMSQKISPFRSVRALAAYLEKVIKAEI